MNNSNQLDGLTILKQAKKHSGEFILEELNGKLKDIVVAIRNSPQKGGSLNINIELKPSSTDGEIITAMVQIKNVKIPTVDTRPIFAFTTPSGEMSSNDPSQTEMFDDAVEIDKETGEVLSIKQNQFIKPIK